jgi:cysteine desulfurase
MPIYFDNAATSPLRKEVIESINEVLLETYGNPSSNHSFGRKAKNLIENSRKTISSVLNVSPQEIIFTSGGTESDNMLLRSAVEDLNIETIISTKIEHHAILHALDYLEKKNISVVYLPVDKNGEFKYQDLEKALSIDDSKKLVSLMHVNNEIGNMIDLEYVSKICQSGGALLHTDAVQSIGHYKIDLSKIKVDFLSAAAHKFHGPKGVGFSFVRKNSGLNPFILGGSQERGLRAGTESVHNIAGMSKAFELAYENLEEESKYISNLKKYAISKINEFLPESHFNGNCDKIDKSAYNLINVNLPVSSEKKDLLDFQLDLKGIACSKGSACQSGSSKGSHVLDLVVPNELKNRPSLRFSFSSFNSKDEIDFLIETIREFI